MWVVLLLPQEQLLLWFQVWGALPRLAMGANESVLLFLVRLIAHGYLYLVSSLTSGMSINMR